MTNSNKIYDYYKDLPAWAKGIVIVGGVGIVAFAGIKIAKAIFPSKVRQQEQQQEKDLEQEIKDQEKQGKKQTFPDSNYLGFANTIYDSIRYCVGDDYANVVSTCKKMMNDIDVAKLILAYGTRQRYCFGVPVGNKLDLISTIRAELGQEWGGITDYRVTQINKDWESKGIKYKI
jgi:hypothetical protein